MHAVSFRRRHVHEAFPDVSAPLLPAHVGELVVAQGVTGALGVVGVDVVLVIGEVSQHLHEVHAVLGLHLVLLHPVEELLLVVGTLVLVAGNGSSLN